MQEFPTLLPSRRHGNWSYYKAQRGEQLVYSYRPPHWVSGSLSAGRSVSWSSRNWLQAAGPVWLVNEKLYVRPRFHQPPRLWHLYKENRHALLGTAHWSSGQKKPELKSRCHIQQHLFYPVGRSSLREVTHEHWRVSFETAFMVAWRHGVVAGPAGLFYPFFFFFLNVLILYLAVLGLHCYTGSSLVVASGGSFPVAIWGLPAAVACYRAWALATWASAVAARGLSSSGSRALERRLSSCGARV